MPDVKLIIDGMFKIDRRTFLPDDPEAVYAGASKCLLVRSGKDNILIDTGIGDLPRMRKYPKYREMVTIQRNEGQGIKLGLAKYGLKISDINMVVNTHLHIAHAGNNYLFENAKFYIGGKEFKFIDKWLSRYPDQTNYLPATYDKIRDVQLVKGAYSLTDDVKLIPTPGHTEGHQSVAIKHDGGTLMFCGDVAPLKENFTRRIPMQGYNRKLLLKQLDKLLKVDRDARWLFAHDGKQLTMRQALRQQALN